jgi:hypothetical protein
VFSDLAGQTCGTGIGSDVYKPTRSYPDPAGSLPVEASKVTKLGRENPNGGRACPS